MATAPATPAVVIDKNTVVGDISKDVFAKLAVADLAKLNITQTADITADQAATFTTTTLAAVKQASLSADALAAIPVKAIPALVLKNVAPDAFNNFSVAQVDEIKKFAGTGAVYFNLFIDGERKPTSPTEINCDFGIKNGSLTEPSNKLKLNNVNLAGKYSNKGGAEKEFLKLSDIRFSTAGGPFSGNVLLTQFAAPNVKGNANGVINLKILHSLFHLPYVDNVSGNIGLQTNFNVKGTLQTDNSINYSIQTCEGEIQLKNIDLKMVNDKRLFHKVNGAMYLRNDEVGIDNVSLEIGKTDIAVNGVFKNIFNYLKKQGDLKAEVEIKSNYLDVADLGTTTKEEKIKDR